MSDASPRRAEVMEALAAVPEPCSILVGDPTDIASMGLVESVEINGGRVAVTLVLTDPSCVHFNGMTKYIEDSVGALDGVEEVEVTMSTTQLWTPDRVAGATGA